MCKGPEDSAGLLETYSEPTKVSCIAAQVGHGRCDVVRIAGSAFFAGRSLLLLSACGREEFIDDSCFVDLAPVSARTKMVSAGDTVTFTAALGPEQCLPAGAEPVEWRWSSTDTLIATIDPITGLALGVSPGDAYIAVVHAREPRIASGTGLQVTSP